jgi:hypothetical protein
LTGPQLPFCWTSIAVVKVTFGKENVPVACSSESAYTGYDELDSLAPMLYVPKTAPLRAYAQVSPLCRYIEKVSVPVDTVVVPVVIIVLDDRSQT